MISVCANLQKVIAAGLHAYFEEYLAETERLLANNDQKGFYEHFRVRWDWKGLKRGVSSSLGTRNARCCGIRYEFVNDGKLLTSKSLELDPKIIDLLPPRLLELSLRDEPSMDEMTEALKGVSDWKVVGPDGLPAELLKIDHPAFAQCFRNILANVWVTGEVPQQ